jgi:hypothetical protein
VRSEFQPTNNCDPTATIGGRSTSHVIASSFRLYPILQNARQEEVSRP